MNVYINIRYTRKRINANWIHCAKVPNHPTRPQFVERYFSNADLQCECVSVCVCFASAIGATEPKAHIYCAIGARGSREAQQSGRLSSSLAEPLCTYYISQGGVGTTSSRPGCPCKETP